MPNRHHGLPKRRLPMTWHAHNNHTPPLHAHPRLRRRDSATPTGGFTTIDTPPRRVAGVSHPYGRNSPHAPDEPKVACNSGARTFYSTPKRCNSNDVMSNLEIHAGELHATFLRNHNMRHHKGPKQKTAQAQNTPTARGERRPQHSRHPRTHSRPSHAPTAGPATTKHSRQPAPTGGFTTIDTPPRRVAGVSHPYGRNSPHTPTHNRQPCARATTQHPAHPAPRPYTTSPPQHSQTPPRHHPRLSVNPSCAHTHTRTRCHPPHVQPPPQRRPRPPPNPSCKRVPNHGLVPHIMAFTCNN